MKNDNPKKEWIERLDNPELSESEQFDLGMEADFNMGSDHMMAIREQEDCSPTLEEIEAEVMEDEKNEKVNFVQAATPEEFFAHVKKVKEEFKKEKEKPQDSDRS